MPTGVYIRTEEHKKRNMINLGQHGQKGYKRDFVSRNKGKTTSEETKEKQRRARLDNPTSGQFKNGHTPWNSGLVDICSEETKRKISESLKGNVPWNKDKMRDYSEEARRERKQFHKKRRRARKKNAEGSHTLEEWEALKTHYNHMCLCCKRCEPEIKLTEDHVVPLSKNGSDYIWNIQPLCINCNSKKYTKTISYLPEMMERIIV